MSINGTEDLRIQKTMAAIKASFEALICEKDYHEITVTELCARSRINKKTFYHYYPTLDDLLEEMQMELSSAYIELEKDCKLPEEAEKVNRIFFEYSAAQGTGLRKNHLFLRQLFRLTAGHVPAGHGCHLGQVPGFPAAEPGGAESGADLHQQLWRGLLPPVGCRREEAPAGAGDRALRHDDVRRSGSVLSDKE